MLICFTPNSLACVRNKTTNRRENHANISSGANQLATRTEQQAAALAESSAALHHLTQRVASVADTAVDACETVSSFMTDVNFAE